MISWRRTLVHHLGQFTPATDGKNILALALSETINITSWAGWGFRSNPLESARARAARMACSRRRYCVFAIRRGLAEPFMQAPERPTGDVLFFLFRWCKRFGRVDWLLGEVTRRRVYNCIHGWFWECSHRVFNLYFSAFLTNSRNTSRESHSLTFDRWKRFQEDLDLGALLFS